MQELMRIVNKVAVNQEEQVQCLVSHISSCTFPCPDLFHPEDPEDPAGHKLVQESGGRSGGGLRRI